MCYYVPCGRGQHYERSYKKICVNILFWSITELQQVGYGFPPKHIVCIWEVFVELDVLTKIKSRIACHTHARSVWAEIQIAHQLMMDSFLPLHWEDEKITASFVLSDANHSFICLHPVNKHSLPGIFKFAQRVFCH